MAFADLDRLTATKILSRTCERPRDPCVRRVASPFALLLCFLVPSIGIHRMEASEPTAQESAPTIEETSSQLTVETFEARNLFDVHNQAHALREGSHAGWLVVAMLGTECPLAKSYARKLEALARDLGPRGVSCVGIMPNRQDSLADIGAFIRTQELSFPIWKDSSQQLTKQLGAHVTPEVFVLDEERRIRYRGRIDDQFGIGYARDKPQRADLQLALEELLSGKEVSVASTRATGCLIAQRTPAAGDGANADITYAQHIAPILQARCVECHRAGEVGPFALTDYEEVAGWSEMIAEVVREERMPPWHATQSIAPLANDRRLTAQEKEQIERWAQAGAPSGDLSHVAKAREFSAGWQLPRTPDLVVQMSPEPIKLPSSGPVEYRYLEVDPQLNEDKWLQAIEVQPGNREVVHHILVFASLPGESAVEEEFGGGVRGFLAGYVPGLRAEPLPKGMAKFLPAKSRLIFQMHYTPNGRPQEDHSRIGFVYADPAQITHQVRTISAFQPRLRIPQKDADHREASKMRVARDAQLLAFMPHMHLRGKSFEYSLRRPASDQWVTLLDIPHYDFNWQTRYRLAEPLDLPTGSLVRCVARYDNSANNPANPDPNAEVRWGEQTWEEMMIGYFDIAEPIDPQHPVRATASRDERLEEWMLQRDDNDDGRLQVSELPWKQRLVAITSDTDHDGVLTVDEVRRAFDRR